MTISATELEKALLEYQPGTEYERLFPVEATNTSTFDISYSYQGQCHMRFVRPPTFRLPRTAEDILSSAKHTLGVLQVQALAGGISYPIDETTNVDLQTISTCRYVHAEEIAQVTPGTIFLSPHFPVALEQDTTPIYLLDSSTVQLNEEGRLARIDYIYPPDRLTIVGEDFVGKTLIHTYEDEEFLYLEALAFPVSGYIWLYILVPDSIQTGVEPLKVALD